MPKKKSKNESSDRTFNIQFPSITTITVTQSQLIKLSCFNCLIKLSFKIFDNFHISISIYYYHIIDFFFSNNISVNKRHLKYKCVRFYLCNFIVHLFIESKHLSLCNTSIYRLTASIELNISLENLIILICICLCICKKLILL